MITPSKKNTLTSFTDRYKKEKFDYQLDFQNVYYVEDDSVDQQIEQSVSASNLTMTRFKEDIEIPYEVCNQFDETGKPYLLDKPVTDCQKLVIKVQNTEPAYCTFCYLDQNHKIKNQNREKE